MNLDWDIGSSNNTFDVIINSKYVTQDWDITGNYNEIYWVLTIAVLLQVMATSLLLM